MESEKKLSTEVKKEMTQVQALRATLNSPAVKSKFEEMLGKRSASFLSSVVSAVSSNKALSEAEPGSVVAAAAVAASLDLPINASLGLAHIVPYKGVAQFQMGWKGFVQLALRSGQYETINVVPVKEGQIKKRNFFTGEMEFSEEYTSQKVVGYLLFFKLINGYRKYFYMTKEECESHGKKYSQSFKKGYGLWVDNFDAMALKTVVKLGISKYGILSVEMQKAIELDQAVINNDGTSYFVDNAKDVTDNEPAVKSLAEKLSEKKEEIEYSDKEEVKQVKEAETSIAEEVKEKPPEKSRMQVIAGTMDADLYPQFKGLKVSEIPEDELVNHLSKMETEKLSEDQKLFYANACMWLGRKQGLKNV